jgi:transposase-like protein
MLHRYRTAMVRAGRERLSGDVEVDETFVGGPKPGKPGRGASGKTIVLVFVEQHKPMGFGRCRLLVIPNVKGPTLRVAMLANVEPGSTIISDDYGSYRGATLVGYTHQPINVSASGVQAHVVLPGVHRVASLLKRWLLGTHQGAVEADHLQAYLDEFAFRFNRRKSTTRGQLFFRLLEGAVATKPLKYDQLVVSSRPKRVKPVLPRNRRSASGSLATTPLDRPWRSAGNLIRDDEAIPA